MNISELARKLKTTTNQLHEAMPVMGLDLGRRAIKIDNKVASKIMKGWPAYQATLLKRAKEKEEADKLLAGAPPAEKKPVTIPPVITVRDFAVLLNVPVTKLITVLMNNGILAALNEKIDADTASIIAEDLGFAPKRQEGALTEDESLAATDQLKELLEKEDKASLVSRPPVVVVMGHVDHGKTSLLDAIRSTNVIAQESGGITQHIGAYQTIKKNNKTGHDRLITFIDTPGHEAFTTMRSRGAKIADIAILVVAADDGVKPQTLEAIKIIKAADLPLIVAINKIDKPDANLDKVKREISDHGLVPEDWGGSTVCVPVSAKKKTGIEDLLDVILLVAEMEKEKIVANPNGTFLASVIESHIDKNQGPLATIIIQNGTLHQNDFLVIDHTAYGKVRAMSDYTGVAVKTALPSQPVQIIGFKYAPVVGYNVRAYKVLPKDILKDAKKMTTSAVVVTPTLTDAKDDAKSVNIILKTDTLGSLEAIANALLKIDHPDVKVKIVSKELGAVSSPDVLRADATKSFIAGFHVTASSTAADIAREKNVEIKMYKIIYELIDDVKERIEVLLGSETKRIDLGAAKVLKIFRTDASSQILGAVVTEGTIEPKFKVTIMRGEEKIGDGKLAQLQLGKQTAPRAHAGQECGMNIEGKHKAQEGDMIQVYREERIKRMLDE